MAVDSPSGWLLDLPPTGAPKLHKKIEVSTNPKIKMDPASLLTHNGAKT